MRSTARVGGERSGLFDASATNHSGEQRNTASGAAVNALTTIGGAVTEVAIDERKAITSAWPAQLVERL